MGNCTCFSRSSLSNQSNRVEGSTVVDVQGLPSHGDSGHIITTAGEETEDLEAEAGGRDQLSGDTSLKEDAAHPKKLSISTKKLGIQVCSDLHTEFYRHYELIPEDIIVPNAPVLALLGDIGLAKTESLKRFLHHQTERFEHVLFVAGNHEYYNSRSTKYTVSEQFAWLQEVCDQRDNLHFLERTAIEMNGIVILGTTMWSKIPRDSMQHAERSMADYHLGYTGNNTKLTAKDTNYQFYVSHKWLEEQINKCKASSQPVVVLTHHTPLTEGTSNPVYHGSALNCCFSTNLPELLQSPVRYWACGHTHWNFNLSFDNGCTRVVSNQRGYPGKAYSGYNTKGIVLTLDV